MMATAMMRPRDMMTAVVGADDMMAATVVASDGKMTAVMPPNLMAAVVLRQLHVARLGKRYPGCRTCRRGARHRRHSDHRYEGSGDHGQNA